jgi:O-antigen ligase
VADAHRVTNSRRALEYAMALFLVACFVLPGDAAYGFVFYIAVLPCLFFRLVTAGPPRAAAFWAGAALIVWSGLTLLWGRDDGGRTAGFAIGAAATLAFWCAAVMCLADARNRERLATMLVLLGCASVFFGLTRSLFFPMRLLPGDLVPRLHGWGVTFHPVLGAAVLAACALTAVDAALRRPERRYLYLAAAATIAVAILCTRSRMPAAALCMATLLRVAAEPSRRRVYLVFAAILFLAAVAFSARLGTSGHFDVWQATLAQIREHPWFGNGLAANLTGLGADKSFPHSLYLSLLFYSGAVGLALFLLWIAQVLPATSSPWMLSLLVNALLAGLTDFGQITKGPGPLWLILWLPAALVVGQGSKARGSAPGPR